MIIPPDLVAAQIVGWLFVIVVGGDVDPVVWREKTYGECEVANTAAQAVRDYPQSKNAALITAITRCEPEFEPKSGSQQ